MKYLATYMTNYTGQVEHENRAIRITAPIKHTSVIDGTKSVWMWFDEMVKGIRLSNKEPDLSLNPRQVPHLGVAGVRKKEHRITLLNKPLYEPAGIVGGSCVSVFEQGDELVYKPATQEEQISAQTKPEKASDGKVKAGRFIRFTKSTMNILGLNVYDDVIVKINTINGCWIEITKAPPDSETPGMRGVMKSLNLQLRETSLDFEYRAKYSDGGLFLPVAFLKKGRVKNNDVLPFRVEDKTVVIEGNPIQCKVCGQFFSQYKFEMGTIKACSKCRMGLDNNRDAPDNAPNETFEGLTRISRKKVMVNNGISLSPQNADKLFYIFVGDKSIKLTLAQCTDPDYIRRSH
jgi:hypothetical protein